ITFKLADILEWLTTAEPCFDVYNLDFYGGFMNPGNDGLSRVREALNSATARHKVAKRSFTLCTTFNVRDRGAPNYDSFLDGVRNALSGTSNIEANYKT